MRTLKTGEVAKAMGWSHATVTYHCRNGDLPHDVTPGGHHRFDLDEVKAWAESQKATAAQRWSERNLKGAAKRRLR